METAGLVAVRAAVLGAALTALIGLTISADSEEIEGPAPDNSTSTTEQPVVVPTEDGG